MNGIQCKDNKGDRELGDFWEKQFCRMAALHGKLFTGHQWVKSKSAQAYTYRQKQWRHYTLPDITIWTAPGEHHEIKHKNKSRAGYYGLEQYRFECLMEFAEETRQQVFYTIHDHDLAGGRDIRINNISHWRYLEVSEMLQTDNEKYGSSWVNGEPKTVLIYYWYADRFHSLDGLWG